MPKESFDSVKIYYPEFSRDKLVSTLKSRVALLGKELPLIAVVLFGSYAKGRQTAASDVDIVVVYRDPKNKDDYDLTLDSFGIPILEPHVYTVSEYLGLIRNGSWLPREIEHTGIVIYGKLPTEEKLDGAM